MDTPRGNSAVLAMPSFPGGKGNPYTGYATPSITLFTAIFDGLTNLTADGDFVPALATTWQQTSPRTWRFQLRQGVRFSNGEAFDASAIVRAANFLKSPAAQRYAVLRELSTLETVTQTGPFEIEITTTKPAPLLPRTLSAFRIVAPEYWDTVGPDAFATAPIGTGPFAVSQWNEASITLERNPGSWRPAALDKLTILRLPDASVRFQTLTSGDVDIAMTLSPEDQDLLNASGFTLKPVRAPNIIVFTFITEKPHPIQDPRVRRALNMAIDREAVIDVFLGGIPDVPSQPALDMAFGYNETLAPLPYDPVAAKALLAEAGYGAGFDMTIEVLIGASTNDVPIFQQIFSDLKQIGVRVNPQIITLAQLVSGIGSGQWRGQGFLLDYNMLPAMDAVSVMPIHSCLRRIAWHCQDALMPLTQQIYAAENVEERAALTRALMAALRDNPPALMLYEAVSFTGLAPRIASFKAGFGVIDYEDIRVAGF
ncbi:MAG: ABC transporter substrate-binding protein [Pseudomonadota bacterium]